METIYLIRHCQTTGQEPEAGLTEQGERDARLLADRLGGLDIGCVVTSPYLRAVASAVPFCAKHTVPMETDPRLKERVLSGEPVADWKERLAASFDDVHARLEGGESSAEAAARGAAVVEELFARPGQAAAVFTHGNLMALLLRHYTGAFGYEDWRQLTNPDVYRLDRAGDGVRVQRLDWRP
ncbi:phosphoglycerate mutase [Paenibacillus sp. J31TS4]|uniref:histidine phosphatase family protein n=1 Tax=Paenibacillus sp. J31TS4 TaxID=2807195 RepID=UPI001B0DAA3F|nr:histidine phosphatase family protein [Paenibacillus sp. J31TS4]GIP37276.1 phosphoglycerate mutase [Paenibacillus sp. J31TS4]